MAYEKNAEILDSLMSSGGYKLSETEMRQMGEAGSEDGRCRVLKRKFNADIARFQTIGLWERGAPGYKEAFELQNQPQIAFFPGAGGKRRGAVIVAPGGAYHCKVSSSEGYPIIKRLVDAGIPAALLDYRVKPYSQYRSLLDMQRAVRLLRSRSDELGIKGDKIAVTGGSAGGHLASMAAVHFDGGDPRAEDPIDRASCRPDAAIIWYGLFSGVAFPQSGAFIKAREEEAGVAGPLPELSPFVTPFADEERRDKYFFSPEKHIGPDTPPFFMWQTCDHDDPRQMFNFAKELTDAGVRFEAHVFPFGPHGMGLADGTSHAGGRDEHVMHWSELAIEWLGINGF